MLSTATTMAEREMEGEIINPYQSQEVIAHRKFISHIGIAFIDLKFEMKSFLRGKKTILRKICGQFNYGTLNGIFGPRQSGKTTLLKCLCGRNNEGLDSSIQFYLNEDKPTKAVYLDTEIENNILLSLTVDELLDYSFSFRSSSKDFPDRSLLIKELVNNLQLGEIRATELFHCTNEERAKAQMAAALCAAERPNMIFVDEPLKQLDVVGTENFINLCKSLSRIYQLTITFSVSQILDSDILEIFDKLFVLSRGGLCVYEGSVNNMGLFLREADVHITSKIQTPMERLLKIAAKPSQTTMKLASRVLTTREEILDLSKKFGIYAPNGVETGTPRIKFRNIILSFRRNLKHKVRFYWRPIVFHYLIIIGLSFILTSAFNENIGVPDSCFNQTSNTTIGRLVITETDTLIADFNEQIVTLYGQNLVEENLKFMFVISICLALFQMIISVNGLNEEVKVAINEHRNGWIHITSFFIVKNVMDLVVPLMNTLTCCAISYFMTGQLLIEWRFLLFLYSQMSGVYCAQSLGFVIGVIAVFNNNYTNALLVVSYFTMVVFSGYLVPIAEIKPWLQGLSSISFLKQTYELTLISLYGLGRCESLHSFVLDEFGIDGEETFLRDSIIILVEILVYRFLFWLILIIKVNKQKAIQRSESADIPDAIADSVEDSKFK